MLALSAASIREAEQIAQYEFTIDYFLTVCATRFVSDVKMPLLRRPAILVLSVLLTASLVCVTTPPLPSRPPSSLPHLYILAAHASGAHRPATRDRWRLHIVDAHLCECVALNHLCVCVLVCVCVYTPVSEWIKNSSRCSGRAEPHRRGAMLSSMSHQLTPVGHKRTHPGLILLALFLFL